MKNQLIMLDPGHGGIDSEGKYTTAPMKQHYFTEEGEWAFEGVLNRHIAEEIRDILVSEGYTNVKYTVGPKNPADISLASRVKLSNRLEADLFVSIHCNASPNHNARGFEVFSSKGKTKSDDVAKMVLGNVKPVLEKYETPNRGVKEENFYVLKKTNAPAILIECGFFDNWEDFVLLKSPVYQQQLARAIACGIIAYLED